MIQLTGIKIYPIKSLGGINLQKAKLEPKGFALDRRWMLVDDQGVFLTQRKDPVMALFDVELINQDQQLQIRKRDTTLSNIMLPIRDQYEGQERKVQIWDDIVSAIQLDNKYSQWFSEAIGRSCHLVYMPDTTHRGVDQKYAEDRDSVSFADGFPYLLASESSLADLNQRLDEAVSMDRFRPNLIIKGEEAWKEDNWSSFQIGDLSFRSLKPCARCVLLTVNPRTAEKGIEPLKTLSTFRKKGSKVLFGINACWDLEASNHQYLKVGDPILVNR